MAKTSLAYWFTTSTVFEQFAYFSLINPINIKYFENRRQLRRLKKITNLKDLFRLTKTQIKPAARMFARAFHDDPVFSYFIPDAFKRKNKSPFIFEFIIRYGLLYGEAYATSPNLEGVVMWLPYEKAEMTLWRIIRSGGFSLYFRVGKDVVSRMIFYTEYAYCLQARLAPFPHWYGFLMGVDPVFQGKGHASALIKPMLDRLDRKHLPCYLETHKEKNVSIYKHYGFELIHEETIPRTSINHWIMLRKPIS